LVVAVLATLVLEQSVTDAGIGLTGVAGQAVIGDLKDMYVDT
jgi:nicotinamide mononucleotide (NMN) deamidase PncC